MKKIIYKIISSIIVLIFMLNISSPIIFAVTNEQENSTQVASITSVSEEKTLEDFKYKIYNETYVAITGYTGTASELTIPETIENYPVQEIGISVFADYTSLTSIEFPQGLTKIGADAFIGCTGLTKIELPDSITELGYGLFRNCTNLTEINYPISLQKADGVTFRGSNKLTKIVVPEGVTKIPDNTFSGCDALKEVTLPSTLQEIGDYAFGECTGLKNIIIPENVTKVGDNLFGQNKDVTIHIPQYSKATIELISQDNNNFAFYTEDRLTPSEILDDDNSSYTTKFSSTYNGGSVAVTCDYAIKEDKFNSTYNHSISIRIPNNGELVINSLYLDKQLCQDYEDIDSIITIPIDSAKGTITFNIKMTENTNLVSYAILNYYVNAYEYYDIIGVINSKIKAISIETASVTNSENITVSGLASMSQDVEIYIDDVYATTVKTNKVGSYSANITLPNVEEGAKYTLKAKSKNLQDEEIYAVTNVEYSSGVPVMTSFQMIYKNKTYDLLSGIRPNITFNSSNIMSFEVTFTNPENVKDVFVTSDRNGITKKIEAKWNESKQAFVTTDYFDTNVSYIPGKINVYYTDINSMTQVAQSSCMSEEDKNEIFDGATAELISETESGTEIELTFKNGSVSTLKSEELTFEEGIVDILGEEEAQNLINSAGTNDVSILSNALYEVLKTSGKSVSKTTDKNNVSTIYYQEWTQNSLSTYVYDTASKTMRKAAIDKLGTTGITAYMTNSKYTYIDETVSGFIWNLGYGTFENAKYYISTSTELEAVRRSIDASNRTEAEKEQAKQALEAYTQQMRTIAICKELCTVVEAMVTLSGIGTFTPQGILITVALFIIDDIVLDMSAKELDYNIKYLKGTVKDASVNWFIDPSGYVYEAVTTNRLEGVKCDLYYLDQETNEPVFWEASEYNQINPLITDSEGKYAWDVPEGLWSVTYSKDGYETTSTEWLEVPPPQTDVNIGLISYEVPTATIKEVSNDKIVITFSKYMKPDTISNIIVKDKDSNELEYTLEYSKNETALDGTIYAKEFTLKIDNKLANNQEYSVVIPNTVKSYSDVSISETTLPIIIEVDYKLGDVNGDGNITLADYAKILAHVKETKLLTEKEQEVADVNWDGKVTLADYAKVLAHVKETALLY